MEPETATSNPLLNLGEHAVLERVLDGMARLEAQVAQLDFVTRELQALTTAVEELTDSNRALLRHQWDNMPPQNFWTRVQRADDEVRRAVDELGVEVRARLPKPGR
jgi:hypothetical protein